MPGNRHSYRDPKSIPKSIMQREGEMNLAEQIYENAKPLPDEYAREALRYIEYLRYKAFDRRDAHVMAAQQTSMVNVWSNEDDEVWNDAAPR